MNAVGKLVFDGSIKRINCITEHEDYTALTNRIVLLEVAPLLRDKNGSCNKPVPLRGVSLKNRNKRVKILYEHLLLQCYNIIEYLLGGKSEVFCLCWVLSL